MRIAYFQHNNFRYHSLWTPHTGGRQYRVEHGLRCQRRAAREPLISASLVCVCVCASSYSVEYNISKSIQRQRDRVKTLCALLNVYTGGGWAPRGSSQGVKVIGFASLLTVFVSVVSAVTNRLRLILRRDDRKYISQSQ